MPSSHYKSTFRQRSTTFLLQFTTFFVYHNRNLGRLIPAVSTGLCDYLKLQSHMHTNFAAIFRLV